MKLMICSSSRDEINEKYKNITKELCEKLKEYNFDLVFGAASTGMMGIETKYFNNIYSYTTEKYIEDLKNINSKEEYIVDTSFDRTKKMFNDSDIILLLPGGTGTLSELFGILEENRSIKNPKPFIIFNYDKYYDNVFNIIENAINNNFNSNDIKNYYEITNTIDETINTIKKYYN